MVIKEAGPAGRLALLEGIGILMQPNLSAVGLELDLDVPRVDVHTWHPNLPGRQRGCIRMGVQKLRDYHLGSPNVEQGAGEGQYRTKDRSQPPHIAEGWIEPRSLVLIHNRERLVPIKIIEITQRPS